MVYKNINRKFNLDVNNIKVTHLIQGATNKCYKVEITPSTAFFIRVQGNGSVLSMSKDQELTLLRKCGNLSLTPKLYAIFDNGYISEFLHGDCITVPMMADPVFCRKIATLTAKWHSLKPEADERKQLDANIWKTIDTYISLAKSNKVDPSFLAQVVRELEITKKDITKHSDLDEILLCHNDLNHGNIINIEKKNSIVFVDLEFAGFNYRNFDLANHFCEWAGLELKYELCPTKEQKLDWLRIYVNELYGDRVKDKEEYIYKLYIETTKWMQISHLFWILWASIQHKISNIDFDYVDYTNVRWNQYHKMKNETLKLTY